MEVSILLHSLLISSPKFKICTSRASESLPPGTELPTSFCASDSTASSVMSTGIKIGVFSYVSNVTHEGIVDF